MTNMVRRDWMKLGAAAVLAPPSPGVEARAVWLHLPTMFDASASKGKQQVRAEVQKLAEHNFNLILPWVPTEYLAALLDGDAEFLKQCPNAAWDSLGVLLEECSKAGLAADIWYPPSEYRSSPTAPDFSTRLGGDPAWAAVRINEFRPDAAGRVAPRKWEDVCLQHPGARAWQLKRMVKFLDRYPTISGLHIEEPGYTYRGNCLCALCREVFEKLYGGPLASVIDGSEAEDFRVLGTSFFMWELRELLRSRYPKLVFSANGGPNWRNDRKIGRDWGRWGLSGWLDYYASQVYSTKTEDFRKLLAMTISDLKPGCPVYGGIAFEWSGGKNTVEEVMRQIAVSRELGAPGVCLFYAGSFTPEFYRALGKGPFRAPAKLSRR